MGKVSSMEDLFKSDLPELEKRRLELKKKIAESEEEKRMIEIETGLKIAQEQIEKIENDIDDITRDLIKELGEGRLKELLEFGIMKKILDLSTEKSVLIVDAIKASLRRL